MKSALLELNSLLLGYVLIIAILPGSPAVAAEPFTAAGITEPFCDVVLSPSVPGIVRVWKCKEGDFVKEGDVILELDNKLEQLEAERRRLVMENRKTEWEALQTLAKKNSISVRREELDKAEADFKISTAEFEMAREQLRKRSIVTPCSGYVAEIVRDPGEACDEYQPIARVVDTRQCYFVSNVEAKAGSRLKVGESVKLEIESASAPAVVQGRITFLAPVVDPASGLQKVKVLFENSDGRLRPGVAGRMMFE